VEESVGADAIVCTLRAATEFLEADKRAEVEVGASDRKPEPAKIA
jgi:hypothetical protein